MRILKTCAVLLSRQPLRPCRQTPWIKQTIEAVKWIKQKRLSLLTSVGMQTWEFLVYLARSLEIEQIIVISSASQDEFEKLRESTLYQFDLDPNLVRFKAIISKQTQTRHRDLLYNRDHAAVSGADILVPVSVRPGGHMEKLIREKSGALRRCGAFKEYDIKDSLVNRQFQIDYPKKNATMAYQIEKEQLLPEITQVGRQYITHWTRATNGPWPDERKYHFFADIENSDIYPRSAFHTLQHILKSGKIIASSIHKPQGSPTVSFSGLSPTEAISLMKWRSRYRQMSFEPYGIGIEIKEAKPLGILPVHYYRKGDHLKDEQRWRSQSTGIKTNWKRELEYRYPGDFYLSGIDCRKMVCFCHTKGEADAVEKMCGIKTYAFCNKNDKI